MDLTNYTDDDLDALRVQVLTEQERRATIAAAPEQADNLSRRYLDAVGRTDGTAWVQPTGAHDAYPEGAVVINDGKEWVSLISGNVWMPGNPDDPQSYRWWREVTDGDDGGDEGDEESGVSAWDPNGKDYAVGEQVTFEGKTYECRQAHTSQPGWTPAAVAALWLEV